MLGSASSTVKCRTVRLPLAADLLVLGACCLLVPRQARNVSSASNWSDVLVQCSVPLWRSGDSGAVHAEWNERAPPRNTAAHQEGAGAGQVRQLPRRGGAPVDSWRGAHPLLVWQPGDAPHVQPRVCAWLRERYGSHALPRHGAHPVQVRSTECCAAALGLLRHSRDCSAANNSSGHSVPGAGLLGAIQAIRLESTSV